MLSQSLLTVLCCLISLLRTHWNDDPEVWEHYRMIESEMVKKSSPEHMSLKNIHEIKTHVKKPQYCDLIWNLDIVNILNKRQHLNRRHQSNCAVFHYLLLAGGWAAFVQAAAVEAAAKRQGCP